MNIGLLGGVYPVTPGRIMTGRGGNTPPGRRPAGGTSGGRLIGIGGLKPTGGLIPNGRPAIGGIDTAAGPTSSRCD